MPDQRLDVAVPSSFIPGCALCGARTIVVVSIAGTPGSTQQVTEVMAMAVDVALLRFCELPVLRIICVSRASWMAMQLRQK